ncbi:MAG: hypothetical protein ACFE0I_04405 [Elainellaceae cyanobacterium]
MEDDMMLQVIDVEGEAQLVFAGAGDNVINAVESNGQNRLDGGTGDDTFLLGTGDRIFGGAGSDRFFVQTGGNNRITGGAGADQFWIANNGTIPISPNRVTDFDSEEDVIGLEGFGTDFNALEIIQQGTDTLIAIDGSPLALLENIDANQLSEANFALVEPGQNGEPDPATLPADMDAPVFDSLTGMTFELANQKRLDASGMNDLIDASTGDHRRSILKGRGGDDTFIVGENDRLTGGNGSDRFFVQSEGGNRLNGGAGADQFWIAVGDIPEQRNIVLDFTDGEDVLGIAGLGIGFNQLEIQQGRNNQTSISLDGDVLAVLRNTSSDVISEADFAII